MLNKNYFLVIATKKEDILIVQKKTLKKWELPRIPSSKEEPIHTLAENYIKKHLSSLSYQILGQSEVVDSYEWPKELASITGKTGEEHRFILVRLESEQVSRKNVISDELETADLVSYDELVEKVIFKNHRFILKRVLEDFRQRVKKDKEKYINPTTDEYLQL
ncbi:MAG: hypothetical protein ACOC32_00880 [Nanoarchaeota archaeon]